MHLVLVLCDNGRMSLTTSLRCTWPGVIALVASIVVGCAEGSSAPDVRRRDIGVKDAGRERVDLASPDIRSDLVSADRSPGDRSADWPVLKDLPRDQKTTPEADVGCGCGAGMVCSGGSCVCDPKTCTGCCTSDGKSCKTGQDNAACGTAGGTCSICSTSDTCKTASCATGVCVISPKPGSVYPCPGAYGTLCGGTTGVTCYSPLTCVTFTSGAKGFCSKTCTGSGSTCTGAPSGMSAECNLSAGSQWYCGFICYPGLCPTGLSCDYSDSICKL
jgi:hypothetical protein